MSGSGTGDALHGLVTESSLRRPPLPPDLVERPRLFELLDHGLGRPLTLLSAPAGYGKSTLVNHWLRVRAIDAAWLSLQGQLDGLVPLVAHLTAALHRKTPEAFRRTRGLLGRSGRVHPGSVGRAFLNDLEDLTEPRVLVVDDFDALRDASALEWIGTLLRHPPRHLHLVLAGRTDPFLPIARLRTTAAVVEVRSAHLRFLPDETLALLRSVGHPDPRPDTARAWTYVTEGWITGLRLAIAEEQGAWASRDIGVALTRHVREYLAYEVLDRQTDARRRLLLALSVPDRFSATLCQTLARACAPVARNTGADETGEEPPADVLGWLRGQALFLVPLGRNERWFRFHRLVRACLRARLEREFQPQERERLHATVSRWFADEGFVTEAIQHALAAEDPRWARHILEANLEDILERGDRERLDAVLRLFPAEEADDRADLLLARAWTAFLASDPVAAEGLASRAEALLTASPHPGPGHVEEKLHALHAVLLSARGDFSGAADRARLALATLPANLHYHSTAAVTTLIGAMWHLGATTEAEAVAHTALSEASRAGVALRGAILALLCSLYWRIGDHQRLTAAARACVEHAEKWRLPHHGARARLYRGLARYQLNQLPSAEADLAAARDEAAILDPSETLELCRALALVYRGQGRHEQLPDLERWAASLAEPAAGVSERAVAAVRAEIALAAGDPAGALAVAIGSNGATSLPFPTEIEPLLVASKALLFGEERSDDAQLRATLLARLEGLEESGTTLRHRIERAAATALLLNENEDALRAPQMMKRALDLAAPAGFLRSFVDFGAPMADYLRRIARADGRHRLFARSVLTAYYEDLLASGGWRLRRGAEATSLESPAATALTETEQDILQLLARGLLYREIADRQFVSIETVKTHLKHIYRKLNVENRRQAVLRARSVGLVPRAEPTRDPPPIPRLRTSLPRL